MPDNAEVKNTEQSSDVKIPGCGRNDTGRYTLVAKNAAGSKSASCKIIVKDTPGMPEQLTVSNVTKKGAKLSWKPPSQDGGAKIQTYIVEKRRADGRGWLKVESSLSATFLNVCDLIEGYEYFFRVCAVNAIGQGDHAETDKPALARDPSTIPEPPTHLKVVDVTGTSVNLKWNEPPSFGNLPLKTYIVERLCGKFFVKIKTQRFSTEQVNFVLAESAKEVQKKAKKEEDKPENRISWTRLALCWMLTTTILYISKTFCVMKTPSTLSD